MAHPPRRAVPPARHREFRAGSCSEPGSAGSSAGAGPGGDGLAASGGAAPTRLSRRVLLAGAATLPLLAAGCRGTMALGTPPRPDPDVGILRTATATEQALVMRYQDALRLLHAEPVTGSEPALSTILARLLAEHQEHLSQLRSRLVPGSPRAAGSGPLRVPRPARPATTAQAVTGLISAEQAASDQLLSQVTATGVPASLAQLLASISASEATHVPVLRRAGAA